MPEANAAPVTLIVHDGELDDLRNLFGEIGAPFVMRRGRLLPDDREARWDLVIATARRVLDLQLRVPPGAQIAVADHDSRTLRNSLRRAGIRLVVRRPVHPAALRALVLHALYRGPEKRRVRRVPVGAAVRYRAGWRQRGALLADLSIGGCRLLADTDLRRGQTFTLHLPAQIAGGRPVSVRARALRSSLAPGGASFTVTARFEKPNARVLERLKAAVEAHASGPATLSERAQPLPRDAPPRPCAAEEEPPSPEAGGESAADPVAEPASEPAAAGDRRESPRRDIEGRVFALGREATRVLVGRDISTGGMRVEPNPLLRLGEDFQLAVHVGAADPLFVTARVHRDDGERGIVLRFHALSPDGVRLLERMVAERPVVEPGERGEDTALVVSEILDGAPPA
jgi:PilZ domain